MKDDSGRAEGNFDILLRSFDPVEDLFNVTLLDGEVIAVTDSGFKEHPDRVGELFNA